MASDCIFCRIVARDVEASIVLDDAQVLAFMDVRPFHPGHVLVIPRVHIEDICALDDDEVSQSLMSAIARVARAVQAALKPDGMNIWQSNGKAAGQEVFHLHFHVLPRYENDGLLRVSPSMPAVPSRSELDAQARLIQAAMQ